MTPQEKQMIDGLISRIRNTPVQSKDTEAEQHIQQSLSGYPDALYVLVQTVLVQQYGLQQAQSQINELRQQIQVLQQKLDDGAQQAKTSSGGGSFLSHIFGGGGASSSPSPQPASSSSQPQYQPVNNPGYGTQGYPGGYPPPPPPSPYPAQAYPQPGGLGGTFGGGGFGGGGFLGGALQTAAGVAAGEMVFQGMEDLFHGFGHGGGYERGFGSGGSGNETVINNYYDDDNRGADRDRDSGTAGRDDQSFYNPSDDASRSGFGDTSQASSDFGSTSDFGDTGSNDLGFDDSSSGMDLGSGDDFSSSDDNL